MTSWGVGVRGIGGWEGEGARIRGSVPKGWQPWLRILETPAYLPSCWISGKICIDQGLDPDRQFDPGTETVFWEPDFDRVPSRAPKKHVKFDQGTQNLDPSPAVPPKLQKEV